MCKKQRKSSKAFVVSKLAKKKISGFLAGAMLVGSLLTPKYEAEAHEAYFLAFLPNIDQLSYQSLVTGDSPKAERDHLEFKFVGGSYQLGESGVLTSVLPSLEELRDSKIQEMGGDTQCMFTFPTCSTTGSWLGDVSDVMSSFFSGGDAQSEDRQAADRVGRELVNGANSALSYISNTLLTKGGKKLSYSTDLSGDMKEEMFFSITANLANISKNVATPRDGDNYFEVVHDGYTNIYTIEVLSDEEREIAGFNSSSTKDNVYLRIKHNNDSSKGATFLYSTTRYPGLKAEYSDLKGATEKLDLFQMIAFANASYAFGGVTSTNVEAVTTPNFIEKLIYTLLNGALGGLRSLLGLNTMSELMFNEGSYGVNTYKGIAPVSWFQASDVLFWVSQVFAWLLLGFATLKFIGLHMWSTVTPMRRVSLMNGIQNILITAFLLSMIVPVFNIVAEFNYLIVGVLRDSSEFNDSIVSGQMFPGSLSGIILAIFFFLSEIVINFMYILRAGTICLLYGLSPVFVVAFAFGGRFQSITLKFVKEIIGNIFIQTFHAVILTFYGLFFLTGNSGGFLTSLVLVFAFIPMTKVFKEITGIGESGFIQGVAEQAKGSMMKLGKTAGKGVVGAADSVVGDKLDSMLKPPKDLDKSGTIPGGVNHSEGFSTSTYEREKSVLNSAQNDRSIGDSLAPNSTTSTNTGQITETSDVSNSSGVNDSKVKEVSLGSGGGSANEFGRATQLSNDNRTKVATYKDVLKGGTKLATGMAFGAVGGMTGSKLMKKAGRKIAGSGVGNLKHWTSERTEDISDAESLARSGGRPHLYKEPTDFDLSNKPNAELHRYDGRAAEKEGILDMCQREVDGNQCLVQEFSAGTVAKMPGLKDISFDKTTGRVTDEVALRQGITHISRMDNGNYRVALDMKKNGIKDVRSMGGGSRYEVKTDINKGRNDMNYVAAALDGMAKTSGQNTSSTTGSTSKTNAS